jgi:CheY-like chemotaxis protein
MKKHVLLVDDDKDELFLFNEALKEVPGSFKCTYASSGAQALEMLNYIQPDYVFIDYNLPVMDGVSILTEIRKDKKMSDIPVFLYSSSLSKDINSTAIFLGASGCIRKPNSIGMMTMVLKSILSGLNKDFRFLLQ